MNIEIISGSPRANSTTHRLAIYLHQLFTNRTGHQVGLIDIRDHVLPPLQEVFASAEAAPPPHREMAARIFASDGFILVTPEYNGSYSPSLQNLLDHFPKQAHKCFGLVTASTGALGGMRAAMQLQQFVLALFGNPSPYMLITPQVDKKFAADGTLLDASFQRNIDLFAREFLWLSERLAGAPVPIAA